MHQHVRLERAHEEQRERARIPAANDAGVHRPAEVLGDDAESAARRAIGRFRIERHHERAGALMHEDGDVLSDDFLGERHEALGDLPEDDSRIAASIDVLKRDDERRRGRQLCAHRRTKQLLLRSRVTQDRRGSDVKLAGDVRERGGVESLRGEHAPCRLQQLLPGNPRRPSHL